MGIAGRVLVDGDEGQVAQVFINIILNALDAMPEGSRLAMTGFEWLKDRWVQDEKGGKVRQLLVLAQELGVSMASLAIAWTIKNPNVTTAILGATKKEQLLDNLKAIDVVPVLTPEVMERIESILQNKPVNESF